MCCFIFLCSLSMSAAKSSWQGDQDARISYIVSKISKMCPLYMWNSLNFNDIKYSNGTVTFIIQDYDDKKAELLTCSPKVKKRYAKRIVEELQSVYYEYMDKPTMEGEGEAVLYLTVGNLLCRLPKYNVDLEVQLVESKIDSNPIKVYFTSDEIAKLNVAE